MTEPQDIRWKQRFENYGKALQTMRRGVELSRARELSSGSLVMTSEYHGRKELPRIGATCHRN